MIKAIRILYIVNIILFLALIPLVFQLAYIWTVSEYEYFQAEIEAAGPGALVYIIIIPISYVFTYIPIIALLVICGGTIVLAIMGLVKIGKAKNRSDLRALAIVQLGFVGNAIPAVLCLTIKPEQFKQNEDRKEE